MKKILSIHLALSLTAGVVFSAAVGAIEKVAADVCVYTATPSGIMAAIAVKREGRSVVIVEPGRWVGGMLGAGLKPMQDCPNYAATGGMTTDLIASLGRAGEALTTDDKRSLNPKVIREEFATLLKTHGIEVIYEHRIASFKKDGTTLQAAVFDRAPFDKLGCPPAEAEEKSALEVVAGVYIDASYEADFLPRAGVSYRVGREAEAEFAEENAGVREPQELAPIDPFVEPGNPESGLLKWVEEDHGKPIGSADGYTQAYNYRYYTTSNPEYRVPFTAPDDFEPSDFELVGRYVDYLAKQTENRDALRKQLVGIFPGWKNSGEWNYQRSSLFSMAPLGISQIYADGDYAEKAAVWKTHQDYLRGLHRFMMTDSRVPEWYREEVAELGLDRRVHPETEGWPHQLYIRVSRRLKGNYTITVADVLNFTNPDDPIGLAQYGIDTYPARRIWIKDRGQVKVGLEGKMFIGGGKGPTNIPYPIPYRAVTPIRAECTNLLVPVCFSASHLGYASARMEPVFMICGESTGIAACHALDQDVAVQDIEMQPFLERLAAVDQKLSWDPAVDQPSNKGGRSYFSFRELLFECDKDNDGKVDKKDWDAAKSGWKWLFPHIDTDGDGFISDENYKAFQDYKADHPDWAARLKKAGASGK